MNKPSIKICVSHRIDKRSEIINNPIYVNVRCGAVYDKGSSGYSAEVQGDDVGENISKKRNSFCELTVLYWAWKNLDADYMGLCHYRRYISFADDISLSYNKGEGCVHERSLNKTTISKYCLDDEEKIREELKTADIITTPVEDLRYAWDGNHKSFYSMCEKRNRDFDITGVDKFIQIIKEKYPKYNLDVDQYFDGNKAKYYNCFIMKKEYFDRFCTELFDILFALEEKLDITYYSRWKERMPGFMGEAFLGIYLLHLKRTTKCRIKVRDLIFFEQTEKEEKTLQPAFKEKNIPIIFSSSNWFAPYASVLVHSIVKYANPQNNYDIIILEKEISEDFKRMISSIGQEFSNISIRFYNPSTILSGTNLYVNSENQAVEAYYRLLVPYIFKNYSKAIVMDCDIIARNDIAELYTIDLGNQIMAGVKDVVYQGWYNGDAKLREYCQKTLTMKNPYNYINTGVLLMDLEKFRNYIKLDKILDIAVSKKWWIQEQDIINLVFEDKIKYIDISWNMYAKVSNAITTTIDDYAPVKSRESYYIAHSHPFLLHWAAQPKPWVNPEMDYGNLWWEEARETPFYPIILNRLIHYADNHIQEINHRIESKTLKKRIITAVDVLFPYETKRRTVIKKILPRGSRCWKILSKVGKLIG